MELYNNKVLIIGSGPAGYSAAVYAARAGLNPILVSGEQPGGQLKITTDVENYPGFANPVQGPWLMEEMKEQAVKVGCEILDDHIKSINLLQKPFCATGYNAKITTDSVIIATGAQAKWINFKGENKFKGFGVSSCATCDGFFYKQKDVIVIGGGNTAVEEAIYLTKHAKKVFLIHRRHELRAEKVLQERLFANKKVDIIWNTVPHEVIGTNSPLSVNGIKLQNIQTGAISEKRIDGVFVAIGHKPNTALFQGSIAMDPDNYIITDADSTATSIPGVFAAGDVQDKVFRQAITAAGTGCMAALEAAKFLESSA